MARMLRNVPNGKRDVCDCRWCRTNDRRGDDSAARRQQRSRERAQLARILDEYE